MEQKDVAVLRAVDDHLRDRVVEVKAAHPEVEEQQRHHGEVELPRNQDDQEEEEG